MAKQLGHNTRYNNIFPSTLRALLENHPVDGHSTTYKTLGEAVGVRQQTISLYAAGQTIPTSDVLLRIAKFFGVSVDYLLTGISSKNKSYNEELGLSDASIEFLKRAKNMFENNNSDHTQTLPYLDELLSDRDFYDFLDGLNHRIKILGGGEGISEETKAQFQGLNIEGYFIWELKMFVEEFIRNELNKIGMRIETK